MAEAAARARHDEQFSGMKLRAPLYAGTRPTADVSNCS